MFSALLCITLVVGIVAVYRCRTHTFDNCWHSPIHDVQSCMTGQDIQSLPTPSWILSFLVKFRQIPGKVILKYFFSLSLSLWPLKFRGWVCGVLKQKYINISILSNYSFLLLSKCMYHFNGFVEANVLYYGLTYYAMLLPWMFTFDESVSGYMSCFHNTYCITGTYHFLYEMHLYSCFYLSVALGDSESHLLTKLWILYRHVV